MPTAPHAPLALFADGTALNALRRMPTHKTGCCYHMDNSKLVQRIENFQELFEQDVAERREAKKEQRKTKNRLSERKRYLAKKLQAMKDNTPNNTTTRTPAVKRAAPEFDLGTPEGRMAAAEGFIRSTRQRRDESTAMRERVRESAMQQRVNLNVSYQEKLIENKKDTDKKLKESLDEGLKQINELENKQEASLAEQDEKIDEDRDIFVSCFQALAMHPVATPDATPASSRSSSRSASPAPSLAGLTLFTETPAKAAAAAANLSPVLEVLETGALEGNVNTPPNNVNTPPNMALVFGTNLCSSNSGKSNWKQVGKKELASVLPYAFDVAQVNDCVVLLLTDGRVIPAVCNVSGFLFGTKFKYSTVSIDFDGKSIQSIQACGMTLLSVAKDGTVYFCLYQGKGSFGTPVPIDTGGVDLFGLGPSKLFGFASNEVRNKDVEAVLRSWSIGGDGLPLGEDEDRKVDATVALKKGRLSVKIADGSDHCFLMASDKKGDALVFRLEVQKTSKKLGFVQVRRVRVFVRLSSSILNFNLYYLVGRSESSKMAPSLILQPTTPTHLSSQRRARCLAGARTSTHPGSRRMRSLLT